LLALSTLTLALSPLAAQVPSAEAQIAGAVSAAPAGLRDGAEVRGYRNYHRMVTLRPGTNAMICLADDPAEGRWHVACYHRDLEPFMARGRDLRDQGIEGHEAIDSARMAEITAGTLKLPDGPRALYNLYAPSDSVDPATGLAHGAVGLQVVYIPYATPESTGLTAQPGDGLPWLMAPGKPWAHIMIMR
jgi:hypothetical protein